MRRSVGTREGDCGHWWASLSLELEHQLLEVWLKTASAGELKESLNVVIGGRTKKGTFLPGDSLKLDANVE